MRTAKLFVNGQELHIDSRIGKGGEGEVYTISNMPGFAVKTYLPGVMTERERKIRAMVGTRLADNAPMVAFPCQVVVDERGAFVGFVMRLVEKHKEIHELQTPSSRQKHFPKTDYSFLVRVALNLARVFAKVHVMGCVIGDINQRGILVSSSATVALIDADSFQVTDGEQQYRCVVGVPEYTPPELQGMSLKAVVRTLDHDAFGLAVCLFQLLCMDRHPFSGRFIGNGEMPLERAISEYRFAYSSRSTGMVPPPGTVRLADFTPMVAQLFEKAFSPIHVGERPSAAAWVEALIELEASLRACSRGRLHRYSRNAPECPWCRMEAEYGRPLFIDTDLTDIDVPKERLGSVAGIGLDIAALMAVINGVAIPTSISVSIPQTQGTFRPSQAARDARSDRQVSQMARVIGGGALICAAVAFAAGAPGIVALVIAAFGGCLLCRESSPVDGLLAGYRKQASALSLHISQLQSTSPIERVVRKKAEVLDAIDEFKELAVAFGNIGTEYEKHRRERQLDKYLSLCLIRGARIAKISSTDIASLASYGFTTAFDAKRRDVEEVHGIGPVKGSNIANWVRRLEASFQFESAYSQEDHLSVRKAQNEMISKQQGAVERIKKLIEEFRKEAQDFERWTSTRDPELLRLSEQLHQTEVDLAYLGVQVPNRPSIAPTPVPSLSKLQQGPRSVGGPTFGAVVKTSPRTAQKVTCPLCGNSMILRTRRRGRRRSGACWRCSHFPSCPGILPV